MLSAVPLRVIVLPVVLAGTPMGVNEDTLGTYNNVPLVDNMLDTYTVGALVKLTHIVHKPAVDNVTVAT